MKKLIVFFSLFTFHFSLLYSQSGIISTYAGSGVNNYSGDGGQATLAELNGPSALVVDDSGNVFIGDIGSDYRIRKIEARTGIINTVTLTYNPVTSLALDSAGNIYITEFGDLVNKYTLSTGMTTVVAGINVNPSYYTGDGGPATAAELDNPNGVAVDRKGNIYIADHQNNVIRKVTASTGIISTVAGNGYGQWYGPGTWIGALTGDGGPATAAELYGPAFVAVDSAGDIYIADGYNNVIRKVTASTGIISRVAGDGNTGYYGDGGPAIAAELWLTASVSLDKQANVYITDATNAVRMVSASNGIITTVAGGHVDGFSGDGGPATAAELHAPGDVACDAFGNFYIADYNNMRVRKVTYNSTGINNLERKSNEVNVFPNPAKSEITFELLDYSTQWSVEIFDAKGNFVLKQQFDKPTAIINIKGFSNGVYLYKAIKECGKDIGNGKFVIQK